MSFEFAKAILNWFGCSCVEQNSKSLENNLFHKFKLNGFKIYLATNALKKMMNKVNYYYSNFRPIQKYEQNVWWIN